GFEVETLNGEWASFDHTTFINSYKYHAHAITQASFSCFRCYFGTMDSAAPVAGLAGQFRLFFDEFVSEIDQRVPTINVSDAGGFVPGGHIRGSWFPTRGDPNNYVIYWNSEAPLIIESTVLTGRVEWDSRKPEGRVFMIGSVIQPAYDAETVADVADPKCLSPRLTGSYTDVTDIDYYIRMYGPNTFRWKRGSPPTDSDTLYTIASRYKNPIEKGIIASFQIGCSYTSGSMWHYPVGKSGLVDIAGVKDNALRIKTSRNTPQALISGSNVYRWDTVEEDL